MRLDPHRLTLWLALFATGATYLALSPSFRQAVPAMREAHWIGLPATGMDASYANVRELLAMQFRSSPLRSPMMSLSEQCGNLPTSLPERYVAHVSAGPHGPFRDVLIDVEHDGLSVSVRDGAGVPAPPPPPPDSVLGQDLSIEVRPVTRLRLSFAEGESIRRAWSERSLWHEPQADALCHDGQPMVLEACIDGRYAARHINCSEAALAASNAMWTTLAEALPAPQPVEWRDTH